METPAVRPVDRERGRVRLFAASSDGIDGHGDAGRRASARSSRVRARQPAAPRPLLRRRQRRASPPAAEHARLRSTARSATSWSTAATTLGGLVQIEHTVEVSSALERATDVSAADPRAAARAQGPQDARPVRARRRLAALRAPDVDLAVTDFRLTYFGSVLGYLWSLMRPLLLFGVLYVVFTQVAEGRRRHPVLPRRCCCSTSSCSGSSARRPARGARRSWTARSSCARCTSRAW